MQRIYFHEVLEMGAPRGAPEALVQKLNAALQRVLAEPAVARRIGAGGGDVMPGSPQDFARFMRSESQKWGAVIRRLGITLD